MQNVYLLCYITLKLVYEAKFQSCTDLTSEISDGNW